MKELKNTEALKKILGGDHKSQTKLEVGFQKNQVVKREVGEEWTDETGQKWIQCDGYRKKIGRFAELRKELKQFKNCPHEICKCTKPGPADLKMKTYHGMCLDCVVDKEHQMRMDGTYDDYEKDIMKKNAIAWLKQASEETEILKDIINNPTKYYDEHGPVEKWESTNSEALLEQIETQFTDTKSRIMEMYELTEEDLK